MDQVDSVEYLIHSSCTWELEERLSTLNSCLVTSYSTKSLDRIELIKTEQSSGLDWENDSEKYSRQKSSHHYKVSSSCYSCTNNLNLHKKHCKEQLHSVVNDTHSTTHIGGHFKCN